MFCDNENRTTTCVCSGLDGDAGALAAEGANASLDFFNSSLAPLFSASLFSYGDVSGETQSTLNGDILVKTDTCTSTTPMRRTTPYGTLNDQIDGGDDYISNTADIPGGKSRFSQVLWQKYTSSPRGMCVTSYRNSSTLIRARSHGAWPGKRALSPSPMAVAPKACAHTH